MKRIAVIPALLNSKRVYNKNLLLVDGYPMIYYVVDSVKKSGIFDEIYINSEELIFSDIAKQLGVNFYLRNPKTGGSECTMRGGSSSCKGSRCPIHDHFLYDFMENIEADYVVQIHTTSPLIKPETIKSFTLNLNEYDSSVTTHMIKSESFLNGEAINHNMNEKQPTQSLDPVESITWAIAGWKRSTFIKEYHKGNPTFCGDFTTFPISKIEAVDVDDQEDLIIAESLLNHQKRLDSVGKFFYKEGTTSIESDLKDLISLDGSPIPNDEIVGFNQRIMNLSDIKRKINNDSVWCYPVVYTDNDQVAFIHQKRGEGCRRHYHVTKDEWWYIVEGVFEYKIWKNINEDPEIVIASIGDIVFLEKETIHVITCISDSGTRLACGGRDMSHIYI